MPVWRWRIGRAAALLTAGALGVIFLAGIIHIATVLLIPRYAPDDGWSRLKAYADTGHFSEVPPALAGKVGVPGLDPLFVYGACLVDLTTSPVNIGFTSQDRFWSLALYQRQNSMLFSVNDRTSVRGRLEMLVVNAAQNAKLKGSAPENVEGTIVVESPSQQVIALLRLYAPDAEHREDARKLLKSVACTPTAMPTLAPASAPDSG